MDYPKSVPGVGLVNGRFVNEDPATGQLGSIIPAEWGNALMSELFNVMAKRGVTPDEAKFNQLAEVIFALATANSAGMVQLASADEAAVGENATKAITPVLLKQETDKKLSKGALIIGDSDTAEILTNGVDVGYALSQYRKSGTLRRYDAATSSSIILARAIDIWGALEISYAASGDIVIHSGRNAADEVYKRVLWHSGNLDPSTLSSVSPGTVVAYAGGPGVPTGWIACNGSALSRSVYADLYGAISTRYGAGDGSTTFNVPDMRGEFIRGWDDARGVDPNRSLGSLQLDALQRITGGIGAPVQYRYRAASTPTGAIYSGGAGPAGNASGGMDRSEWLGFDSALVARSAAETRPRNVAMQYIIKY